MCVEKYTYDVRNLGQAEGAHKVGASARCSVIKKLLESARPSSNNVLNYGVPENACIFGESEATISRRS